MAECEVAFAGSGVPEHLEALVDPGVVPGPSRGHPGSEAALRHVPPPLGCYGADAPSPSIRRALDTDEERLFEEAFRPVQASCSGRILHRRSVSDIR